MAASPLIEQYEESGALALALYERAKQTKSAPDRYAHIDFKPPKGVQKVAGKSLEWREEYGRGGTPVGIARARDLSNGEVMSPDVVRRAVSFFARHSNNKAKHFGLRDGVPTTWRIAWDMWGGDPGRKWFESVLKKMEAADEAAKKNESDVTWLRASESSSVMTEAVSFIRSTQAMVGMDSLRQAA